MRVRLAFHLTPARGCAGGPLEEPAQTPPQHELVVAEVLDDGHEHERRQVTVLAVRAAGDLLEQESKVERSGLREHFHGVEIVSRKDRPTYERIARRRGIAPHDFVMVGNSLRSDILPVVAMGGLGVHIPYHTTWAHEEVAEEELARHAYVELRSIRELPDWIASGA